MKIFLSAIVFSFSLLSLLYPFRLVAEEQKRFYAKEDATLIRWLEYSDIEAGEVKKGDRLEVIMEDGEWVRVRFKGRYGWMKRAILTEEEPAPDVDEKESLEEEVDTD